MSTRSKYRLAKPEEERTEPKADTDILMRLSDRYGKYVSRALALFLGEDKQFVIIKAAERLIDKALWVAEVVRRKVEGLHQINVITEKRIVDTYIPLEEGLVQVEKERFLTIIEITLTRNPTGEQRKAPGYQEPLKSSQSSFLSKEAWLKQEKQRSAQDRSPRAERNPGSMERQRERKRGRA